MMTLAFDVYGTLIDTSGVLQTVEKMIGGEATTFIDTWRSKQLEYSFRRGLMNKYVDFSVCTRQALDYTCLKTRINLSDEQRDLLMREYKTLPKFDDVKDCLETCRENGHQCYAFSNGSYLAVTQLLEHANVLSLFNGIVSVENTEIFKPHPRVYGHFNEVTYSQKEESVLISGNAFDVMGAISYGMKAVWVRRSPEAVFDTWGMEPTKTINSLSELAVVFQ